MYPIYFIYIMVGHVLKNMFNLYNTRRFGIKWLKQIENEFNGQFDAPIFNKVAKYQSIQLHLVNEVFTNLYKTNPIRAVGKKAAMTFFQTLTFWIYFWA